MIVPSGLNAGVLGYAIGPHNDIKKSITDRLAQQDLFVPTTVMWLRLRLIGNSNYISFIWPANLCLWKTGKRLKTEAAHAIADAVKGDAHADPLVRAEEWYAARFERADALAKLRKNEEFSPQLQYQDTDSDEDDAFSDEIGHSDNRIIVQDMAGVYPTPPDGPPSHPYSLSAITQQDIHASVEGASLIATNAPSTSPLAASFDLEHDPTQYEENGNESLFGDMDTDLFASNGLTEADFNFFDEPSVDGNDDTAISQQSHTPSAVPLTIESSTAGGDAIPDNQSANQPDTMNSEPMKEARVEVIQAGSAEGHRGSPSDIRSLLEADRPLAVLSSMKPADLPATCPDNSNILSQAPKRDSFHHVPFRSSHENLDAKYAEQGRFRFEHIEKLEGEEPIRQSHQQNCIIPRIGSLRGAEKGLSNGEEDVEDYVEGKPILGLS